MKILAAVLFVLMFAAADEPASNISAEPELVVEFQNDLLTVQAEEVPLLILLAQIEEKSGIEIELRDEKAAVKAISVDLKNLAPARALEEILRGLNFAYLYSGARLARVIVLPQGAATSQPVPAAVLNRLRGPQQRTGNMPLTPPAGRKPPAQTDEDSRAAAKLEAIEALEDSSDPKSITALADMLTDPSSEVKEAALQALADKKGTGVTESIRKGLNDRDPEFRIEVLEVLADRGDLDSLRRAKSDPNKDVRERAAELLERETP